VRIQAEGSLRDLEDQAQRIRDLEQQLDAANHRITELQGQLSVSRSDRSRLLRHAEAALKHIESLINELFLHRVDVDPNDEAVAVRKFFAKALAGLRESRQRFPTEDPPFDACQCSACLALRRKARV
jgi:chromosome segregation ATPase